MGFLLDSACFFWPSETTCCAMRLLLRTEGMIMPVTTANFGKVSMVDARARVMLNCAREDFAILEGTFDIFAKGSWFC